MFIELSLIYLSRVVCVETHLNCIAYWIVFWSTFNRKLIVPNLQNLQIYQSVIVNLIFFFVSFQPLEKQLSFTPLAQPPLRTNSLFSADSTKYPDVSAARQENNRKQTVVGSGEAVAMTSSLERRRQNALLTNWRKETMPVQHLTCIITK